MDSYDFYNLYFRNHQEFTEIFKSFNGHESNFIEILKSIEILAQKSKLKDFKVFSDKIVKLILSDETQSNFQLDGVLENLKIDDETIENLITENSQLEINKLRIFRVYLNQNQENYEKISEILIDELFRESLVSHYVVGLLKLIMKSEKAEKNITKVIFDRCQISSQLSQQNLCFFFDKICENNLVEVDDFNLILKYFINPTKLSKKQAIFIIKTLINFNLLTCIENFKIFTIILESLDENPSHIILPTLELMRQIKVDEDFHQFWFILCQSIMNHENNQVKLWGLNYVLSLDETKFINILEILRGINSAVLYEDFEFIKNIKKFIWNNFEEVFESLIEIQWNSVPFYNVLEAVSEHVATMNSFGSIFLVNLHKQTEMIPKRIKNISIRGGIQVLYSKIVERIIRMSSFVQLLPTVVSVFKITDNHSSIDGCLRYVQRDDHEFIFNENFPYDFLKYLLLKLYIERDLSEMRKATRKIRKSHKIIMEVICELNQKIDGYEDDPDLLIHETIDMIFKDVTNGIPINLIDDLEVLEIGLNSLKCEIEQENLDHLVEIWRHIDEQQHDPKFKPAFWKILSLILKYHKNFETSVVKLENYDKTVQFGIFVECEIYLLRNKLKSEEITIEDIKNVITNLEELVEKSKSEKELKILLEILRVFVENVDEIFLDDEETQKKIEDLLKNVIRLFKDVNQLSVEFWERYLKICSILTTKNRSITTKINKIATSFLDTSHEHEQFELLKAALNLAEKEIQNINSSKFEFLPGIKDALIRKMFEAEVMAKEVQIEFILGCKLSHHLQSKLNFRLDIAKFFSKNHQEVFKSLMIQKLQVDLPEFSKKKVRYFTNSHFHRLKMHLMQPIALLDELPQQSLDSLLNELLIVNNQLNITYFLEIVLAKFYKNFLTQVKSVINTFKSQPLKSIFAITLIQIKNIKSFAEAEKFLDEIFNLIFPFTMGQNYGVRCYAMISIIFSLEHVKSLLDFKFTLKISKIDEICELMMKCVQNASTQKFFTALREDFRFVKKIEEVFRVECFYGIIPMITKMPFEEILNLSEDWMSFKAADILKSIEDQVMIDELEIPIENGKETENGTNLQQKYLPYKFKIPGDNLLRTLPNSFKFYDESEMNLKPHSDLIVVASLIEHSNNLGGLARSCEIFGVSNYVINSLRSIESLDFKSLSKTAEKWIKITEIKSFQLMDYLMGMKMAGYSIVGAEQTGNSVSLVDAKIPKKCVLLLGNEKEGISANFLSLLDLTIEIPQVGVVRSLNVHVTASIILWEYAKQHLF